MDLKVLFDYARLSQQSSFNDPRAVELEPLHNFMFRIENLASGAWNS